MSRYGWVLMPLGGTSRRVSSPYSDECVRDCSKTLEATCRAALETAEKRCFSIFWPPYTQQMHARSVARTPFRTVSEREFCELRAEGVLPISEVSIPRCLVTSSDMPTTLKVAHTGDVKLAHTEDVTFASSLLRYRRNN